MSGAPVPLEGNVFKRSWLKRYQQLPFAHQIYQIVQSWDTASKTASDNDFSVCTTWALTHDRYYLVDVFRSRLEFPPLCSRVREHARIHAANVVLVEDADSGRALIQTLQNGSHLNIIPIKPEGAKEARALAATASFESGRIVLPEGAPWLGEFEAELLAFPAAKYCDQVDSVTQFITWVQSHATPFSLAGVLEMMRANQEFRCEPLWPRRS